MVPARFYQTIPKEEYTLLLIQLKQFSSLLWHHSDSIKQTIYSIIQSFLNDKEALYLIEDDFLIFLHCTNQLALMNWIAVLDDTIERFQFFHIAAGIRFLKNTHDFETCRKEARFAMLNSHDHSKYTTSYEFYDEKQLLLQKTREEIERYLPQALAQGNFQIYLQPKIDTMTCQIVGAEALLRLFHHDQQIPLSNFLSYANQNAFIRTLDLFVLERSCHYLQQAAKHHLPLYPVSINISPFSFYDGAYYLEEVKQILHRYQIPPALIEFELSEDISLQHDAHLFSFLNRLQQMGHRIALDDFGSGYSSLSLLSELPVDMIKLDQSFFYKPLQHKQEYLLSSLIQMLKTLRHTIIAEGVETKEVYEFLRSQGVDMIQGYYFYHPISIASYNELIKLQNSNGKNHFPMI